MTTLTPQTTVGELVAQRPARARVFERLGIDYCCGGRLPLEQACVKRSLDLDAVLADLRDSDASIDPSPERDWTAASATELADHIEAVHHAYLRSELPRLHAMTAKVANVHGAHRRGLVELRNVFDKFTRELSAHMAKEERILFPWIRLLEGAGAVPTGVSHPVAQMVHEHDDAGEDLARMRALTDGFTPPLDACGTYRAMLDGLKDLEADMHAHVHKENNILFPKALSLEKTRAGAQPGSCCTPTSGCCGG
jgi:regulator of cell morphogenesis and NO signaling